MNVYEGERFLDTGWEAIGGIWNVILSAISKN
jgi:hypothetical protein